MNALYFVFGIVAVLLCSYLLYALVRPEKF